MSESEEASQQAWHEFHRVGGETSGSQKIWREGGGS